VAGAQRQAGLPDHRPPVLVLQAGGGDELLGRAEIAADVGPIVHQDLRLEPAGHVDDRLVLLAVRGAGVLPAAVEPEDVDLAVIAQ
jgi:hypothetical protein